MFDKGKELEQMRARAMAVQKQLAAEEIVVERGAVKIVISGDQKIRELTVQGVSSQEVVNALNEAIKKSQELAAKKLQEMSGGLSGLLGGMGGAN